MNSMLGDPFGMFGGFGGSGHRGHGRDLMPFGFRNMNDIFQNFQINTNDPNCHSFSSSTVMTMSSGPDGRPQVYQASQSTRTAPGGIRETQKSVCDSRTGTKKLAIGHHIGDRSHVMEREQNMHSGQMEERQEFINLDEDEADDFNREWETRARSGGNSIGYGQSRVRSRRQRDDIPAILDR
ncbi:Myeloid leukemia factor, putative [Pediculus humanus corporis]|uniref:Myeloid leukemia factor, putative n=1 Tax=Pediculus humanus subsp. corporis TaxID=121224 RepID=E0VNC4_PEDHC|nr:Myeloid leukemia factor, putative [Pediculus humanus corporis]EEB14880.1 Myeloid leukemia factor, putative [Pediculus humanus corporis]